jgi:toxin-antitoxin system PIN domain toxin
VIAVDTNLLVYAHREDNGFHERADELVTRLAEANAAWAIPWPCLHEFYGVVTHPRVFVPPTASAVALDEIGNWLESPSLRMIGETSRYWRDLRELLEASKVVGPRVHDARIAAICHAHRVTELWSADRDFSRFTGVKVRNPLE